MRHEMSATIFREIITQHDDVDVDRVHYCYQLGSTFTSLALMEDTIINAMLICDRIKVSKVLGPDAERWREFLEKRKQLQDSTLGTLVSILARHGISPEDLNYIRWVKNKRDFFVHRFFHEGHWPGELVEGQIEGLRRRLLYLERIYVRASHRIWAVLARAGLMERVDLGKSGSLMINTDLWTMFKSEE
jgi:hypothetical protein